MAIATRIHQDGTGGILKCTYEFAVDGGAVGTLNLPVTLPAGAIIYGGMIDVDTDPTSGGSATVALGLNTNTDLLAATAIASITGRVAIVPVFTAASAVKLTAERTLKLTVAVAALTAGKMDIYLNYYEA
jgi:hypothetical protein